MPKKAVTKKKTSTKAKPKVTRLPANTNVEKVLVENFISLQKVLTNLAVKFDNLGAQISKLLELFEISAKTLAEKDIKLNAKPMEDKKVADKLDSILDQNKIIARGLTLLHEGPSEMPMPAPMPQMAPPMQQPIPPMQQPMPPMQPPMQRPMPPLQPKEPAQLPPLKQDAGEYQKSERPRRPKSPRKTKKNETAF